MILAVMQYCMHVNVVTAFNVILVALRVAPNYYHSELLLGGVYRRLEEGLGGRGTWEDLQLNPPRPWAQPMSCGCGASSSAWAVFWRVCAPPSLWGVWASPLDAGSLAGGVWVGPGCRGLSKGYRILSMPSGLCMCCCNHCILVVLHTCTDIEIFEINRVYARVGFEVSQACSCPVA